MHRPPPRRFTLIDAMVLIAATAVGIALVRHAHWDMLRMTLNSLRQEPSFNYFVSFALWEMDRAFISVVTPWTIALLALGMRPPRPRLRLLARQPGTVACFSACLTIAAEITQLVVGCGWLLLIRNREHGLGATLAAMGKTALGFLRNPEIARSLGDVMLPYPGLAVLVVWSVLRLQGRWRRGTTWIDRTGRFLGGCWIIHYMIVGILHCSNFFLMR